MGEIHVEEQALTDLKEALSNAGEDYKSKLARLVNLMNEITSGDIQGDPADVLLAKFEEKRDTFDKITQTIEEAEEYTGLKTTKFATMISNIQAESK